MSEMKLIMESWRRYKKEDNSTLILREIKQHLEIHSIIQEGFFDDLAQKIPGGKKALPLILTGMIGAGALSPDVAAAAEKYVDNSGVNVEQAMEVSSDFSEKDSEEKTKKPIGQALKKALKDVGDSFKKDGTIGKPFQKDGPIGKLFSKIAKSQDEMSDLDDLGIEDTIILHIMVKKAQGLDLSPDEKRLLDLYNQHGPNWDSKLKLKNNP